MALTLFNTDNVNDTEDGNFELNGATSVTTVIVGGNTFVIVAGIEDDGVSVFQLATNGTLTETSSFTDADTLELDGASAVTTAVFGANTFVCVAGFTDDGLSTLGLSAAGDLTAGDDQADDGAGVFELNDPLGIASAVVDGVTFIYVASRTDDGVAVFRISNTNGNLISVDNVDDAENAALRLDGARAVATAVIGGTTYVYVASDGDADNGISVFEVGTNGVLNNVDNVADNDNVDFNLDGANALATAVVGAKTFLFVSADDESGVSVFEIQAGGLLSNVENVKDDATLEIQGASSVSTANIAGTTYLFVTGRDDNGFSVFAVAADGSLINVANQEDSLALKIGFALSSATAVVDGDTFLFVTGSDNAAGSSTDDGFSAFRIDTTGLVINGTAGNDVFDATNSAAGQLLPSELGDLISGLAGNDTIVGLDGDDILVGGTGKDILTGDAGADKFDFNKTNESRKGAAHDVITDFNRLDDRIDLANIDAQTGGGNQKFKFIGKQGFHQEKGELHFVKKAGFVFVEGDVNGDGKADFQIQVDDVGKLTAGDFFL
jgi:6-phosphogluconolactonase (cycloisomerase 2 family)